MKQALSVIAVCCCLAFFAVAAQAAQVGKIVAVVNGDMITLYDLERFAYPELQQKKLDPKNPAQKKEVESVLKQGLDLMIMDRLMAQEADKQKITVSDNEIDEEVKLSMKRRDMTEDAFWAQIKREGFTKDAVRDRIKKGILRQKLMGMMVGRKVVVTPEEVKKYFEEHKSEMVSEKQGRMALIIYPDKVDAAAWAKRIKSGSISFEDAVRQTSIGPNREGGGDVGPLKWRALNPQWREKLSSMSPGEVSQVFIIEGKKAQIKLLSLSGGDKDMTLAEATPQIENILREPRLQERFKEYVEQLRKKAVIDIRF